MMLRKIFLVSFLLFYPFLMRAIDPKLLSEALQKTTFKECCSVFPERTSAQEKVLHHAYFYSSPARLIESIYSSHLTNEFQKNFFEKNFLFFERIFMTHPYVILKHQSISGQDFKNYLEEEFFKRSEERKKEFFNQSVNVAHVIVVGSVIIGSVIAMYYIYKYLKKNIK